MPHQVPVNTTLWNMVITQAKARFSTYPSPGASHWVHSEYERKGGKFKEVSENTRRADILRKKFLRERKEKLQGKSKHHKDDKKKGDT
jgi:hypothetical protein